MLNLITGTPGAGKTLYAVFLIDKFENENKRALQYNALVYKQNLEIILKNSLEDYFTHYTYFSKITKNTETVLFEPDYFDYLFTSERKEQGFLDIVFYNGIINNIQKELDIKLKPLKFVRHIYANIDGLKVDFVRPIEIDWRKCPDGSIIFYDEIQLIPEYSNDNKQDKEGIIKYLTVHRHRGFDIYGITQFPRLVNPGFRDVVGLHYHLHRGWGAPSATVYVWANCREKPNSLGNKFTAERDFRFNYPKRLYQVYESATANTVKLRIPLKLFAILIIPILGLIMVGNMIFGGGHTFFGTIFGSDKDKLEVKNVQDTAHNTGGNSGNGTHNSDMASNQKLSELNIECRKAINVEKPECVKWFDELSKNNSSISAQVSITTVSYNPDKPFDQQKIQDSIQYNVTAKPVLSGCMKTNNRYQAYTQQGTRLNVSQADCKKIMSGDRPFNYFTQQGQQNGLSNQNSTTSGSSLYSQQNTTQDNAKMTAQEYELYLGYLREQQQANNYVQPQLQNNITGANAL